MHSGHPEGRPPPPTSSPSILWTASPVVPHPVPFLGREDKVPQRQPWSVQREKPSTNPTSTAAFGRWTTYLLITSQNRVSDI